jgi:hypothetical protein
VLILRGHVGDASLVFSERPIRFQALFSFPRPVQSAHAVLQGFRVSFSGGREDNHVQTLAIDLDLLFDPAASQTSGAVNVAIHLRDRDQEGDMVSAEVDYLIVGEPV